MGHQEPHRCRQKRKPVAALRLCLLFVAGFSVNQVRSVEFTAAYAWGNRNDATAVPTDLTNAITVVSSLDDNVALKRDGTLVGWGQTIASKSPTIGAQNGVKDVSLGYEHGLALLSNGTVVAWGDGIAGENSVPPGLSGVVGIAAGGH